MRDLYHRAPEPVPVEATSDFDKVLAELGRGGSAADLTGSLRWPAWQFLVHAASTGRFALHGSAADDIVEFQPRQSNDVEAFGNRTGVHAAADGLWPFYFAIVDRTKGTSGGVSPPGHDQEARRSRSPAAHGGRPRRLPVGLDQLIAHPRRRYAVLRLPRDGSTCRCRDRRAIGSAAPLRGSHPPYAGLVTPLWRWTMTISLKLASGRTPPSLTGSLMLELACGQVVWINFSPVTGSDQGGHRPAVIVSSNAYLAAVPNVVIVVPVTTRNRHLPNHVRLRGEGIDLQKPSFAMTEQPRTVDRRRVTSTGGHLDAASLSEIRQCLARFLVLE